MPLLRTFPGFSARPAMKKSSNLIPPSISSRGSATLLAIAAALSASLSPARAAWETVVDGSSLASQSAFTNYWSYDYPWGSDHNGSARMNAANVSVADGIVTVSSRLANTDEGHSSSPPHLRIRYESGTFYLKQTITISPQFPVWDFSGQFRVPTQNGTWPAFWITGAHSWPPESDFMEFKGTSSCHQNTYDGAWQAQITPVPAADTSWHTYRVLATLQNSTNVSFRYYIDDTLESTQIANTFVDHPCWLIIDYQMEGDSGSPGPNEPRQFCIKNIVVKRETSSALAR